MKITHRNSGITIETSVIFHEEIHKYGPGVVLINTQGMQTSRMAPIPTMHGTKEEAEKTSLEIGKTILSNYLSGKETLYFDQNSENT